MKRGEPKMSAPIRQLAFEGWLQGVDEDQTHDDWYTPPELIDLIRDFFGGEIDLDPCASTRAFVGARINYTKSDDGMTMPWVGDRILNRFVNPPYSDPRPWIQRIASVHASWPREVAGDSIALVKCDPSTRAWESAWSADAVLFFRRRVQFIKPNSVLRASAMFPSALLYWGPHAEGFDAFFGELGHVAMRTPEQLAAMRVEREHAEATTAVDEEIVR